MNKASTLRFSKLTLQCEEFVADKARQSANIWRCDFQAIIAAAREIERLTKQLAAK